MKKLDLKKIGMLIAIASFVGTTGSSFAVSNKANGVDQAFVEKAAQGGLEEVKSAKLAQSKSQNTKVINLTNTLISEHSDVNLELTKKAKTASIMVPTSLSPVGQARYDKLNRLEGKDFERQYLQNEIADHENTIQSFKFEISNGKNSTLKTFATNTLPTLQNHLKMTRQVLSTLDD